MMRIRNAAHFLCVNAARRRNLPPLRFESWAITKPLALRTMDAELCEEASSVLWMSTNDEDFLKKARDLHPTRALFSQGGKRYKLHKNGDTGPIATVFEWCAANEPLPGRGEVELVGDIVLVNEGALKKVTTYAPPSSSDLTNIFVRLVADKAAEHFAARFDVKVADVPPAKIFLRLGRRLGGVTRNAAAKAERAAAKAERAYPELVPGGHAAPAYHDGSGGLLLGGQRLGLIKKQLEGPVRNRLADLLCAALSGRDTLEMEALIMDANDERKHPRELEWLGALLRTGKGDDCDVAFLCKALKKARAHAPVVEGATVALFAARLPAGGPEEGAFVKPWTRDLFEWVYVAAEREKLAAPARAERPTLHLPAVTVIQDLRNRFFGHHGHHLGVLSRSNAIAASRVLRAAFDALCQERFLPAFAGKEDANLFFEERAEELLAPPPYPAVYSKKATAEPWERVHNELLAPARPRAVVLYGSAGAGKSTVAAALADDAAVVAAFDDVVYVTVGRADSQRAVVLLQQLLGALEDAPPPPRAAAGDSLEEGAPLDEPNALAARLRAACERRAVLLVADDVWAPRDLCDYDFAALLCNALPAVGGGANRSTLLLTTRAADDRGALPHLGGGVARVPAPPLDEAGAARYLAEAALLGAEDPLALAPVHAAFGGLPLSLTLAAACLRAEMAPGVQLDMAVAAVAALAAPAGAPAAGMWLGSPDFCGVLRLANKEWDSEAQRPVFFALQGALQKLLAPADYPKFAIFGLLRKYEYAPEAVLGAAWGLRDAADTHALLRQWQAAGLVKWEPQARRAVLHDLAHDFASAIAATATHGATAAHGALVDRCGSELVESERGVRAWWKPKRGVDAGGAAFVGGGQLLRHLRDALRGEEVRGIVWELPWILSGVAARGVGEVIRELDAQMVWEERSGAADEAGALALLKRALVMGRAAWAGQGGPGNVAPHLVGRLGRLAPQGAAEGRLATLLSAARSWDGGGRPWLRPVQPNFDPPGGECEAVLEGGASSVCALGDWWLASASSDNKVRVWDSRDGSCLRVLAEHNYEVNSVCSFGSGRLASASDDGTVLVWDAGSGARLGVLRHERGVTSVCGLGDGRRLASASVDKVVRVWDAESATCLREFTGHEGCVNSVCALGDGGWLASASHDTTVRLWDLASDAVRVLRGHEKAVLSVCALGNGGRLASGSRDATVRLWDAGNGTCSGVLRPCFPRPCFPVRSVCASSDGSSLASASSVDGTVCIWDTETTACRRELAQHSNNVLSVCSLGHGRLASASGDGAVRVWAAWVWGDARRSDPLVGHGGPVNSVCTLGDRRLASASDDRTVRVWNAGNGRCVHVLRGHAEPVNSVCAAGGTQLASASDDTTVRVWDFMSGAPLRYLVGNTSEVRRVFAVGDGRLASHAKDRSFRVWGEGSDEDSEVFQRGSEEHSAFAARHLAPSDPPYCAGAHFAPWGAPAVHLGANVVHARQFAFAGRRVAAAVLSDNTVHFLELVAPRPGPAGV